MSAADEREPADANDEADSRAGSLLWDLLARSAARPDPAPTPTPRAPWVAECVDARHPTLSGRVRARYRDAEERTRERWVPTLAGLSVRQGDRLLLLDVSGLDAPVAIGVIDGFTPRPAAPTRPKATLELQPDETLRVDAADGTPLLEVLRDDGRPVVRLANDDVDLDLPGRLRIRAASLELVAKAGDAKVQASADAVIVGETVRLN